MSRLAAKEDIEDGTQAAQYALSSFWVLSQVFLAALSNKVAKVSFGRKLDFQIGGGDGADDEGETAA
eukprot:5950790-Amphidinium_carterae.1